MRTIAMVAVAAALTLTGCPDGADLHDRTSMRIEGPERAVIGFPLLLRFTVDVSTDEESIVGVPEMSPAIAHSPIQIRLRAVSTDEEYLITPRTPYDWAFRDSCWMMRGGECRSGLIDVGSLRSYEGELSPTVHDISPGRYKVSVLVDTLNLPSATNEIEIELVHPSQEEIEFVRGVEWTCDELPREASETAHPLAFARSRTDANSWAIAWNKRLKHGFPIVFGSTDSLSAPARAQLRYYCLAHELRTYSWPEFIEKHPPPEPSEAIALIQRTEVPDYLEPDRQALALLWRRKAGQDVGAEIDKFLKENPGLCWKFEERDETRQERPTKSNPPRQAPARD